MKKVEDMKRILKEHKNELKEDYCISEIGHFVHFKNHLSDLLEANVDLVMKRALKPEIGERVLREVVYI